jgi:glucuronate isomerase
MSQLGKSAKIQIKTVDDVLDVLSNRLDFFIQNGCVASDHGMDMPPCTVASDRCINTAFKKALVGKSITPEEIAAYKTKVYVELGKLYAKKNIVMQYHMNAIRDNNSVQYKTLGANTGFDAVHDMPMSKNLAGLLDLIEKEGALPKTIVYSLNPADYYPIATVLGCFQNTANGGNDASRGKMQFGAAWWFDDHRDGMELQLKTLASTGMLSAFVGMLTDSRSFLSYPRHEYFRRILCNVIGRWVDNGEYPADWDALAQLVQAISFGNARKYFGL